MPIIVGSPRSGTTLLRFMLDSHPDLAIPPETGFLPTIQALTGTGDSLRELFHETITSFPPEAPGWSDFGIAVEEFRQALEHVSPFNLSEGTRAFYRLYARRFRKSRYGDKTPLYGRHMVYIQRLLPEAHFIHIIRDGRDVAASLRKRWFSPGYDMATQAEYWRDNVQAARDQGKSCDSYCEVRYESLLQDPESILRPLCRFLELDFATAMLEYHRRVPERIREHGSRSWVQGSFRVSHEERMQQQALTMQPPVLQRIGAWKNDLTAAECDEFDLVAGDLHRELGYSQ